MVWNLRYALYYGAFRETSTGAIPVATASPHNSHSWYAGCHSRHTRITFGPPPVQWSQRCSQTKVISERGCQGGCCGVFCDFTTIKSICPRRTRLGACILCRVKTEAAKESCRRRLSAYGETGTISTVIGTGHDHQSRTSIIQHRATAYGA